MPTYKIKRDNIKESKSKMNYRHNYITTLFRSVTANCMTANCMTANFMTANYNDYIFACIVEKLENGFIVRFRAKAA